MSDRAATRHVSPLVGGAAGGGAAPPDDLEDGYTVGVFDPCLDALVEDDPTGRRVADRYRVMYRLGGGGMADVYVARDERLGCDIALKLLKPRVASPDMRMRMIQEARAAAAIDHPNLVRVIDVGECRGTAYIAMELIDGRSLEQHLAAQPEGRLAPDELLALLLPTLDALHAIHERGFVHRDIKPGNLVLPGPGSGRGGAVVIDLGIVKVAPARRAPGGPPTTALGHLLGTPAYMAPEQAHGRVDRRADVYAVGVTLYRALAGRLPFPPLPGQGHEVILARHAFDAPPSLVRLVDGLSPALAAVVERALAKDPADRPATMRALAAGLRAALPPARDVRPVRVWWPAHLCLVLGFALGWGLRAAGDAGRAGEAALAACDSDLSPGTGAQVPRDMPPGAATSVLPNMSPETGAQVPRDMSPGTAPSVLPNMSPETGARGSRDMSPGTAPSVLPDMSPETGARGSRDPSPGTAPSVLPDMSPGTSSSGPPRLSPGTASTAPDAPTRGTDPPTDARRVAASHAAAPSDPPTDARRVAASPVAAPSDRPAAPVGRARPRGARPPADPHAVGRHLAAHAPAVQACVDRHGGLLSRLDVHLNLDADDRVTAVATPAAPGTMLERCVRRKLLGVRLTAPGPARVVRHTFTLAPPR
jgi:serine/threonine-protein kinase